MSHTSQLEDFTAGLPRWLVGFHCFVHRMQRFWQVDVVVIGAGGPTGRLCVQEALSRGLTVRAVVRDPAKYAGVFAAGVDAVRGDVTDSSSLEAALRGARNVVYAASSSSYSGGGRTEMRSRIRFPCLRSVL